MWNINRVVSAPKYGETLGQSETGASLWSRLSSPEGCPTLWKSGGLKEGEKKAKIAVLRQKLNSSFSCSATDAGSVKEKWSRLCSAQTRSKCRHPNSLFLFQKSMRSSPKAETSARVCAGLPAPGFPLSPPFPAPRVGRRRGCPGAAGPGFARRAGSGLVFCGVFALPVCCPAPKRCWSGLVKAGFRIASSHHLPASPGYPVPLGCWGGWKMLLHLRATVCPKRSLRCFPSSAGSPRSTSPVGFYFIREEKDKSSITPAVTQMLACLCSLLGAAASSYEKYGKNSQTRGVGAYFCPGVTGTLPAGPEAAGEAQVAPLCPRARARCRRGEVWFLWHGAARGRAKASPVSRHGAMPRVAVSSP